MKSRIRVYVTILFLVGLPLLGLESCSSTHLGLPQTPVRTVTPVPSPNVVPAKPISLVAHRGSAGLAAENTLTAFRIGIAFNSDFLEMDVHLTKDGVPIVMYDPTINRTTDGKGRIADMTLAELGRFSTHSTSQSYREPIPTLAQVLDLAQSKNVQVEVEIKVDVDNKRYPGIEQKVLDELAMRNMLDRSRILAFEFDTLKQVRAINPCVKTVALMSVDSFRSMGNSEPVAMIDDVASFSDGISVNKDLLSAQLVEAAHNRKLFVGVWAVDTASEMQKFIEMGVDSITTNRPDVFTQVLRK